MDEVFKKSLLAIRSSKINSFSKDDEALIYGIDWFYGESEIVNKSEAVSEKTLILDSFAQTIKETMATKNLSEIEENGAIISLKEEPKLKKAIRLESLEYKELLSLAAQRLNWENVNLRYRDKKHVKILFISDYILIKENYEDNEFNTLFEGDIAKLFSNMVVAMKLRSQDYVLSAIKIAPSESSYTDILLHEIDFFKPELIITLGVSSTHELLDIKDRLKDIHGKFFDYKINNQIINIMPLFSPHLLGSALNMKKIAWQDMQKAMGRISI